MPSVTTFSTIMLLQPLLGRSSVPFVVFFSTCRIYYIHVIHKTKKPHRIGKAYSFCGLDGTRTRDPVRDRHVF